MAVFFTAIYPKCKKELLQLEELIMDIYHLNTDRNGKTVGPLIAHFVWTDLTRFEVYILNCVSLLPVSDEAWGTVAGQLSVGAVASIEAGVVPRVIATHGNGQLGPSARRHIAGHCNALQYVLLEAAVSEVLLGSGGGMPRV